jgi:hypothetical protein
VVLGQPVVEKYSKTFIPTLYIFIMLEDGRYLHIYKGSAYQKKTFKRYQKIIVFDLDETLGSFGDLYILWTGLQKIHSFEKETIQEDFNTILDLYPEFLRCGILYMLEYLYNKKKQGECNKLFIYTNNICNPPWVELIIEYLNKTLKIKGDLFDKIISAFKINNKIVEVSRTKREKTCSDLIRCALLPKNTEICFVDDTYHRDMLNEKVYYIQPHPYYHGISTESIIKRFMLSDYGSDFIRKQKMDDTFYEYIHDWFYFHIKPVLAANKTVHEINIFVSQKMMYHIKEFFYLTNRKNKTRRKYNKIGKFTRKNYAAPVKNE